MRNSTVTIRGSEPITFIADEESFEPSVPIPPKVLAALVKTDAGKQGLEFASAKGQPVLADLFRVVEVHLSASEDTALVVRGVGSMSGADNDWFWICPFSAAATEGHPLVRWKLLGTLGSQIWRL